ncbi:protein kinase domain-containing protein [Streptomyces bacillaris]|uniref:protein kinase domain-containing protein n=1 Tax=Streptomyces bacillaris TaxID=68179 RepID=UPI00366A4A7E
MAVGEPVGDGPGRGVLGALPERAPRRIGPYRILARLGAGGMGEVYLGVDTRPAPGGTGPQPAAVKTVRRELVEDRAFRDRFRREMDTARSVESRFTARLLSGDAEAAEPWLATEYVAGPTLEQAVRAAGPLPVATVRALGLDLVRGLRGIHHARVQHRDLKPSNVLLGRDGAKVIDFGIARAFGAGTMTATGAMLGSPGHMSPEHVLGGRHVVAASDVFCLASVLCYAATGESPFGSGPLAAVLYRISQAEADLRAVPDAVRELIEDCLSADPARRPDSTALEERFRAAVLADARTAADASALPHASAVHQEPAESDESELPHEPPARLHGPARPHEPAPFHGSAPLHGSAAAREPGASEREPGAAEDARPGSGADRPFWPPVVRELVAAHESELAAVVAAAGPLTAPVPTMPGASPVHSAATVTRPPAGPAPAPSPGAAPAVPDCRRPGRRRRTIAAAVAAVLALGVLGAVGLRAWQVDGGDEATGGGPGAAAPAGPSGSASPSESGSPPGRATAGTGLGPLGAERSRYFPADPAARPAGWKPWSAKLDERPWSCALSPDVLVCRTLAGGLEAVRPSDGRPLWKAASPFPDRSAVTGNRGVVLPGHGSSPLIQDDVVVTMEAGVIRGRSATDGTVRWESDTGGSEETQLYGDPLLGEDVAFFTLDGAGSVYAVDVRSGERLWEEELTSHDAPMAGYGLYRAEVFVEGRLIAVTDGGLVAFDARTGKRTPVTVPGDKSCAAMRVHGGQVYCDIEGQDTAVLDAVTLRPILDEPDPGSRAPRAQGVVAAGGREYVLEPNEAKGAVELTDLSATGAEPSPRTVGALPGPEADQAGSAKGGGLHSEPVIVGSTALFADNRSLHTLPLRGGGSERHDIEGAPGHGPPGGSGTGTDGTGELDDPADKVWAPEVISIGGVLYLVFHDGTVRSVELPA